MAILCVREKRKRVSVYIYYIHTHILVCVYILIFFRNVLNVKNNKFLRSHTNPPKRMQTISRTFMLITCLAGNILDLNRLNKVCYFTRFTL